MESLSKINNQSWLVWFLRGILLLGFLVLFVRAFDLQIIRGGYYRGLAEGNRIRRVAITAPRGKILARGGETLVGNKEVKKVVVFNPDTGYEKTEEIEGYSEEELIIEWMRDYKLGSSFGHVSGYVGEVNEEELGKVKAECLDKGPRNFGDKVGRTGLEQEYDCFLTGIDGEELVEVDARGRKIRSLGRKNPIPGGDLVTTIDYGLQQKASKVLEGKKGGIVVTDPVGEVFAFYSSPSYDPNIFVDKKRSTEIKRV